MNYSCITQIGRLVQEVEFRYAPSGTAVATFTLATNYGKAESEEVCFIDVVLFRKQAELAKEYLQKGKPVLITGRLSQDKWEDKQTGQKRSKHKIIGNTMVFLGTATSRSDAFDEGSAPRDDDDLPF